jgi:hypothetical protein
VVSERLTRPRRHPAGGSIKVADETIKAIAKALEKTGVEFIGENGGRCGCESEEA